MGKVQEPSGVKSNEKHQLWFTLMMLIYLAKKIYIYIHQRKRQVLFIS
jgi:hypothetical protein